MPTTTIRSYVILCLNLINFKKIVLSLLICLGQYSFGHDTFRTWFVSICYQGQNLFTLITKLFIATVLAFFHMRILIRWRLEKIPTPHRWIQYWNHGRTTNHIKTDYDIKPIDSDQLFEGEAETDSIERLF